MKYEIGVMKFHTNVTYENALPLHTYFITPISWTLDTHLVHTHLHVTHDPLLY